MQEAYIDYVIDEITFFFVETISILLLETILLEIYFI